MDRDQLDLFGTADAPAPPPVPPVEVAPGIVELARKLPDKLRFGTSSWNFPGWIGLVYGEGAPRTKLSAHGLRAYSQHPLLRSVGVDRTFYAPMPAEGLREYADQVPDDFRFMVKAHEVCTLARFHNHPRFPDPGAINPHFLDPSYALREVVAPAVEGLGHKLGVVLLQFSPQDLGPAGGPRGLFEMMASFFEAMPEHVRFAVELRNANLFCDAYVKVLADAKVGHCLNVLPKVPKLSQQLELVKDVGLPWQLVRWMLAPHHDYESAKAAYDPFDRLADPDPDTRAEIAKLTLDATEAGHEVIVIANNKAEGSSPLSLIHLAREIGVQLDG